MLSTSVSSGKLLFLILLLSLACQTLVATALPELHPEEMEQLWWENLLPPADSLLGTTLKGSFHGRSYLGSPDYWDAMRSLQILRLQNRDIDLRYANFIDFEKRQELHKLSLAYKSSSKVKINLHLGDYRVHFGTGLVCGTGRRSVAGFDVLSAASAKLYNPCGAALKTGYGSVETLFFYSSQNREYYGSDSLMSSVASGISGTRNSSMERLWGVATGYKTRQWQASAMYYTQGYDKDFAQSTTSPPEKVISLSNSFRLSGLRFDAELAASDNKLAQNMNLKLSDKSRSHLLRYVSLPEGQKTAYASNPFAYASYAHRKELSYLLETPLAKNIDLSFEAGQVSSRGVISVSAKNSIMVLGLKGRFQLSTHEVKGYSYSRALAELVDSSYVHSIPRHYRFDYRLRYKIDTRNGIKLYCSYRYEEKADFDKNSFYWNGEWQHRNKDWGAVLGLQTWQSLHSIVINDAGSDMTESSTILRSRDAKVYLGGYLMVRKLKVDCRLHLSLHSDAGQALSLALRY